MTFETSCETGSAGFVASLPLVVAVVLLEHLLEQSIFYGASHADGIW